ncbi:MAG: hypothetical protein HZA48_09690 [Planctomycetes bacterium]|nr:hypothetical protein [Planctomycetota bacterium]
MNKDYIFQLMKDPVVYTILQFLLSVLCGILLGRLVLFVRILVLMLVFLILAGFLYFWYKGAITIPEGLSALKDHAQTASPYMQGLMNSIPNYAGALWNYVTVHFSITHIIGFVIGVLIVFRGFIGALFKTAPAGAAGQEGQSRSGILKTLFGLILGVIVFVLLWTLIYAIKG